MNLTENQKNILLNLVKEVRNKLFEDDKIIFLCPSKSSKVELIKFQEPGKFYSSTLSSIPIELKDVHALETGECLLINRNRKGEQAEGLEYECSLTDKAYEAVDSNFTEPDRSAIRHLIPLTEVEHLDSELWERVRISLSAGGDNPKAWDTAIRTATVVLEERLRQRGKIDDINQKTTGNGIVNLIFGSNKSVQKDKLPPEKLEAYRDLYSGTMKLFRNHYAHRFIDPKPEEGGAIIVFIDLLLKILDDLDWETENENT